MTASHPVHGRPTAQELLEATEQFLTDVVAPRADPDLRFHLRVAANLLAVVRRELDLGPAQQAAHEARLAALGYAGDRALADSLRAGGVPPGALPAVRAAVEADVRARLAVANPRYLEETP